MADHDIAAVQAVEQAAQHGGLAGTNFAGDDDEAIIAQHAVLQVGLGTAMLLAAEVEVGVWVELERLASQPVKRFVHGSELHSQVGHQGAFVVRIGGAAEQRATRGKREGHIFIQPICPGRSQRFQIGASVTDAAIGSGQRKIGAEGLLWCQSMRYVDVESTLTQRVAVGQIARVRE